MQLIPLDIANQEHVDFTYEILQARYQTESINIEKNLQPTYEQHLQYLKSDRCRFYYIINVADINIGTMYVLRAHDQLGFFIHSQRAYTHYKTFKKVLSYEINKTVINNYPVKKITYLIAQLAFKRLMELHGSELPVVTSRVCYDNKKSREATEFILNFKPKYVYYEYRGE